MLTFFRHCCDTKQKKGGEAEMMKTIFLLTLNDPESYPPASEIVQGFVVVAEDEHHARGLVSNHAGDEGESVWYYKSGKHTLREIGRARRNAKTEIVLRDQRTL